MPNAWRKAIFIFKHENTRWFEEIIQFIEKQGLFKA
jgi:hypothetical protein